MSEKTSKVTIDPIKVVMHEMQLQKAIMAIQTLMISRNAPAGAIPADVIEKNEKLLQELARWTPEGGWRKGSAVQNAEPEEGGGGGGPIEPPGQ